MSQHDRLFRIMTLVALALVILTPLAAEAADGKITGLTAAPSPATTGSPVTITVIGSPPACGSVDLDYGDGTPHATLVGPFPLIQKHIYQNAKTFSLKAKAGKNCNGQASASLTVGKSSVTALTDVLARARQLTCPTPRIDDGPNNIQPGSNVAVYGCGFGSSYGRFVLKLESANKEVALDSLVWRNGRVFGIIPLLMSGVMDQPATLQIVTANNAATNLWPTKFTASRDFRSLRTEEMQVIRCGGPGSFNGCNTVQAGSFNGWHNTWWLGGDGGTDEFSATLRNGWVFVSCNFRGFSKNGNANLISGGPQFASTSTKMDVRWGTEFAGHVDYHGYVCITGPFGVPYR